MADGGLPEGASDPSFWALKPWWCQPWSIVLTGVAGPAFAAFYNFATDFFPLINSSRLFRREA